MYNNSIRNIRKKGDWRYICDLYVKDELISKDMFYKYTLKHKIRIAIGITGSIDGYYFYGIHCKDKDFHMDRDKYFIKNIYDKFLKRITPLINKII